MKVNAPIINEPETSFDVRFTSTEAEQLSALIDMAVKYGGVRVAGPALMFMQKLQAGLETAIVPSTAVPKPPLDGPRIAR